ncbi:chromosome segregation SMC family protein, partial [candidate division CSSED10-310 bacterium]
MYFEKLDIQGFKSFVDRTVITFKPGITAIVGPNGCGKSNISDAIRWVLGEQNVRNLRGSRIDDLIFSGSPKRKPIGMAEVTLTINSNGDMPRAIQGQLEITRRLFRNGESEFYINKIPCRLKDIVDIFMDSGLGKGSYALIEQGKVDLVLRSKPKERRILIEEAAGIVRYKAKKEEALHKMSDTRNNLLRIDDRLYEMENQAAQLKSQANRAKRYLKEKEKLINLEKVFAGWRLHFFRQNLAQCHQKITQLSVEITKHESDLAKTIIEKEKQGEELEALREKLNSFHKQESDVKSEIDLSLQKIEFDQERIKELIHEIETLEGENEELSDK